MIYAGTFSKVLVPSLRVGDLVAPPALVDAFLAARQFVDSHPNGHSQEVLAAFMAEGHFARHLRRMRNVYRERQEELVAAASRELAGRLDVAPAAAGMHLVGWLPSGLSDLEVARRAHDEGVDVLPLSHFHLLPPRRAGLLLGYTASRPSAIRDGVRRLARALASI